jgi:hypothetical protein
VETLNAQSSPPATVVELYADWSRGAADRSRSRHRQHHDSPDRADPGSPTSRLPSFPQTIALGK